MELCDMTMVKKVEAGKLIKSFVQQSRQKSDVTWLK